MERVRGRPGTRFLDPAVLARIDNLELLARTVVDGFLNGLHRSPYLGLSTDFAEHRSYMPGDDPRTIDWRLWARTDRHYVKQYEAETNADFVVLLDTSRSMAYGSHGDPPTTKLDYARYLAACLAYFSRRQRDRVGIVTFGRGVRAWVPPSARHLDRVLHVLDRAEREEDAREERTAGGAGLEGLERPLLQAAESLRRSSILALVSDLYDEPERVRRAVGVLGAAGHDVMVFHVLDPHELEFPFEDATNFRDLESGEEMPVLPGRLRDGYRAVLEHHLGALESGLTGDRVDYALLDTSKPLDHALHRYLAVRQARTRKR